MGYILTPGVNGVNGVKEEGRGMEGIWGKSPARGKRAATPEAGRYPPPAKGGAAHAPVPGPSPKPGAGCLVPHARCRTP